MKTKVWTPIFVLTIIAFKSIICKSCSSWSSKIPGDAIYSCYDRHLTNKCKFEMNETVIIHEPNKEEGTMNFEFYYEPSCYYELEVFMWPKVNNEESCYRQEMTKGIVVHSIYSYSGISGINYEKLNICTEKGNITAKFIYTGCYYFLLHKTESANILVSVRKFLTTRYKKMTYSDFQSEFFVQHRIADSILEIKHPFLKDSPNLKLIITCTNCSAPSKATYRITPTLSNISTKMEYNLYCYKDETPNITINCEFVDVDSITCRIKGLIKGEYEIEYIFRNLIRCPLCTDCGIWGNCSKITKTYNTELPTVPIPPDDDSNTFPVIYFVLLGLVFAGSSLTIAFLIYRWCRRYKPSDMRILNLSYNEEEVLIGDNKILLLYPIDAEVVMETMKTLRVALQAEEFEVYDINDQDQQKSIAEVKEKWIIDKLSDKFMKIVIVQTYCGQILLNSSHSAHELYKKPTWHGDIFQYAMSLIRARVDPNSYTKLFIVNMGFDKMDYTEFNFLNPCVRYGLPQNFKELIRDMHHQQQCSIDMPHNKNELSKLILMCKNMKNFIEDPNYLSDILHVVVYENGDKIRIKEPF